MSRKRQIKLEDIVAASKSSGIAVSTLEARIYSVGMSLAEAVSHKRPPSRSNAFQKDRNWHEAPDFDISLAQRFHSVRLV